VREPSKLCRDLADAEARCAALRATGARLVLTNGTFDLLHVGHVRALDEARRLGDALVVGLNSDESVRAYKGPSRPLVPEADRAEVLCALACVDLVVIFGEATAEELVHRLRPAVYAKGRDYEGAPLPEARAAAAVGARLAFTGDPKQRSSSELIRRLRESDRAGP
jgi:rfaE bifunctional protein nucleotidyltransferase chain/domain